LEYKFSFGWSEVWGLAYRTDYDLQQHMKLSGQDLSYRDPNTNAVFVPHVIEPAVGINRLFLMCLTDAYREDAAKERTILELSPKLAPYLAAVFPLVKNKPEIVEKAQSIFTQLSNLFSISWDDRGNIGKRYLSQDEIGTPVCITVDFQTLEDQTVTIRNRTTTDQTRVAISDLEGILTNMLR